MKSKFYLLLAGLFLFIAAANAQAPDFFNYQGVARDASGAVLPNRTINLRFTIHKGSELGTAVYVETQTNSTNQFGLFTAIIGSGTPVTGTIASIQWGNDNYYLEVEMDPNGGTTYLDFGTEQLLSVPYALYAGNGGSNGNKGTTYTSGTGISIVDTVISANTTQALWNANKLQGDSISTATPTTGQVLQWDGTAWSPTAGGGNGWNLTGNNGTTAGTNFIGTTDANDVVFKTNSNEDMRITNSNGYVGIGTSSPASMLHIDQTVDLPGTFGGYQFQLEIDHASPTGYMAGIYINGTTNTPSQVAGIVESGGNSQAFYTGLNDTWDYRIGGMSSLDQYGVAYAKDGNLGITVLNSNGDVGIGTTAPKELLHVVDYNSTPSGDFGIFNFQIETESVGGTNACIYINGSSSYYGLAGVVESGYGTAFYSGLNANADYRIAGVIGIDQTDLSNAIIGTPGITVSNSTGYVGLNTSSPAQQLDVEGGNIQFAQALMPNGDPGTTGEVLQSNGANTAPVWSAPGTLPITVSATSVDLSAAPNTYTVIITADGQTVTLPAASSYTGKIYVIVAQMTSGSVTISSFNNLGGVPATTIASETSTTLQSDGTNWDQIR